VIVAGSFGEICADIMSDINADGLVNKISSIW
jgi:hypothetical protein